MNFELNRILLNRKNAINIDITNEDMESIGYKKSLIATASANLASIGYCLSSELIEDLCHVSIEDLVEITSWLIDSIRENLGADVDYKPMYPGFPKTVMEKSKSELYIDALNYALSGFTKLPEDTEYHESVMAEAAQFKELRVIQSVSRESLYTIASNLMASQVAFTPTDKEDLLKILADKKNISDIIPAKIPNKENLTWLAAEYIKKGCVTNNPFLKKIKTPTDLLRLIAVRNGYDSSLTEQIKFKSLPRSEVKMYAKMLLGMKRAESEIYQRSSEFKKLSESYHFRSVLKNTPDDAKMQTLLDKLYQKELERSFLSKRDKLIAAGEFNTLIDLYKKNPGQMGVDLVRLTELSQNEKDKEAAGTVLVSALSENAKKMSTGNLLKVREVIKNRQNERDLHVYSPKKGLADPYIVAARKEGLPKDLVAKMTEAIDHSLSERYEKKRPLGKVYIDEALSDIKLPTMQRNAAAGSIGMSFGSKLPADCEVLRSFIWWTNKDQNEIDIDLSAAILDENFQTVTHIGFFNLKESFAVHSGDIRDGGPKGGTGAAEFIDVDLKRIKGHYINEMGEIVEEGKITHKPRYIMYSVRIYSGDSFDETPCKFGWMESDKTPVNLFDISKVSKAIELNSNSDRAITVMYDIDEKKMIWMDRTPKNLTRIPISKKKLNTNISYMSSGMVEAYRAIHNDIPNLYDLMSIHVAARGELVSDPKEADTIFSVERLDPKDYPNTKEFVCAYDSDAILGDLVSDELSQKDEEFFARQREMELENVDVEKELLEKESEKDKINPMLFISEHAINVVRNYDRIDEER